MSEIIQPRSCRTCHHHFKINGGIECRLSPPVPYPILGKTDKGAPALVGNATLFPQVQPDMWCAQHRSVAIYADPV